MAKFTKELASLEKRLTKIEKELRDISIIISTTDEISNLFWSKLKRDASKAYEKARIIFKDWNLSNIPDIYKKTIQGQIRRIKNISFKPKVDIKQKSFLNKDLTKQTISTILEDSLASFYSGTQIGEKKLNRLMGATQQLNIKEKKINQLIQKGFVEGAEGVTNFNKKVGRGSVYGVQRSLQKELLKNSLDGKTITIVNKNGKAVNYNIKSYSELVARTKLIETQSSATVNLSMEYDSGLVQVSSHNTFTPYDAQFEGKVFDLTGKNPRFPTATDLPPFHVNPYDKETEILTKNGWKKVNNIKIGEKCFSLNIYTRNVEYVPVTKLYEFYQKEMIHFKNKLTDSMVSFQHNMLWFSYKAKKENLQGRLLPAISLLNKKSGSFYAGCNWIGKNNLSKDYIEFLGYYISEGHCNHYNGNYMITIFQSKIKNPYKYNKMLNCIKRFYTGAIYNDGEKIQISNKEIYLKLKPLGNQLERYIPKEIKNETKENIKIFLDAFCLGDGSVRKTCIKHYNENKFYEEKVYYTASNKIMADLCELIIKLGKKPSVKITHKKGSIVVFKNKTGVRNNDVYCIREINKCYNSLYNMEKNIVPYNDHAYCVELERNHVLLTKRNGKVIWSGNCQHTITVFFEDALNENQLNEISDFSKGKIETHPTMPGHKPISERKFG